MDILGWFKRDKPQTVARVTLGVQALVRDGEGNVLLVRHGYRSGWHFPGGGVERNEQLDAAVIRELLEETGVVATPPPDLFGIYSHFDEFPGDHIVLYVINCWERPAAPAASFEIPECRFFPIGSLPARTSTSVRRRLDEVMGRVPISQAW